MVCLHKVSCQKGLLQVLNTIFQHRTLIFQILRMIQKKKKKLSKSL